MILREEDLKILREVPANSWHILMNLAQHLAEEHRKIISSKKKRDKPRLWGALEGQVWISDDFNDPLEFVSEGEMRVLEAMRTEKKENTPHQKEAVV